MVQTGLAMGLGGCFPGGQYLAQLAWRTSTNNTTIGQENRGKKSRTSVYLFAPIFLPNDLAAFAPRVLYERVAEQMANTHLRVFDTTVVSILNHDCLLGNVRHPTALGTHQRHCLQTMFPCPGQGFDAIGRIPADAQAQGNVARARVVLQLSNKNIFVSIIVGNRRHPTHVVVERDYAKPLAHLVRSALAKVGGEMRRVGCAAAVAKNEDLAILFKGGPQILNQLRDRFDRNAVVGRLLDSDIICNPLFHLFSMIAGRAPFVSGIQRPSRPCIFMLLALRCALASGN